MTKISAKKSQSFSQHLQQSSFFFVCFNLHGSLTVRGEIFLKIIGLQFGKVNYLFVYL